MLVSFEDVSAFEGWEKFPAFIESFITSHGSKTICEVGAGANPALPERFVLANSLTYTILDSDSSELDKAAYQPRVLVCDICGSDEMPENSFDLIFSRMTFEHCRNSAAAHRNILQMLKPGGFAVHSFATLYALPFLVNRVVPEAVAGWLLDLFSPRDRDHHDKFPVYYDLCRGPRSPQLSKLNEIGFEICEYRGFFGHSYYLRRLNLLHWLESMKTRLLLHWPVPLLTSYATVILRKC